MIAVPDAQVETAFHAFVEEWFRMLSKERWADAVAALDEPNSYGVRWSEVRIREALSEYSAAAAVSDPAQIQHAPRVTLGAFDDGTGYWLDYDVPLDGVWSDLTAQFEFKRHGDKYSVILHDLHVL